MAYFNKVSVDNRIRLIWGENFVGKTAFSVSTKKKVYLIDTEFGHNGHALHKHNKDALYMQIMPDATVPETVHWFSGKFGLWKQIENGLLEIMDFERGVVVFDTASDLLPFAVATCAVKWEREEKAFPTMMYGQVYGMVSSLVGKIRTKHEVVMSCRAKPIFIGKGENSVETGFFKPDIYRKGFYISDDIIEISVIGGHRYFIATKGDLVTTKGMSEIYKNLKYDDLSKSYNNLKNFRVDPEIIQIRKRIEKGKAVLSKKAIPFENKIVPDDKAREYLDYLTDSFKNKEG